MKDWVELTAFTVDCIVGILATEQRSLQPVEIDLKLALDLEPVAGGDLSQGMNYAAVQAQVTFLLQYGQWRLLESAAFAIQRLVLAPPSPLEARGQVEIAEVTLRKPTILEGAVPGIHVQRDALWCDLETRMIPPKTWVDVLAETDRVGAYRVHIEPGTTWKVPAGAATYVLGGEAEAQAVRLSSGQILARGETSEIGNVGSDPVSLLVVTSPPLPG